jgi:hypothetical protein
MTADTQSQFKSELNSFFMLVLLNLVFGALAMAFGMQYMIMAVLGLPLVQTAPVLRVLADLFVDNERLAGNPFGQFRIEPGLITAKAGNGLVLPLGHGRFCPGQDLIVVIVKVLHLVKCRKPFAVDGPCAV